MTAIKFKLSPFIFERICCPEDLFRILKLRELICLSVIDRILIGHPMTYSQILYPYCDHLLMKNGGPAYFGDTVIADCDDTDTLFGCVAEGVKRFEECGVGHTEICTVQVGGRFIGGPWCKAVDDKAFERILDAAGSLCKTAQCERALENIRALVEDDAAVMLSVEHDQSRMKPYQLRELSRQCFSQGEICEKHILRHDGALICSTGCTMLAVIPRREWDFMRRMSEELLQKVYGINGIKNVHVRLYRFGELVGDLEKEGFNLT